MGDLSEHFSKSEFACRCGCGTAFTISPELITALEAIRNAVGVPLPIDSGFRCQAHNVAVGGGPEHPAGKAADIFADDSLKYRLVDAAYGVKVERIGVGQTFVHIGVDATLPKRVLWGYKC